jgi:hypothetical protein
VPALRHPEGDGSAVEALGGEDAAAAGFGCSLGLTGSVIGFGAS